MSTSKQKVGRPTSTKPTLEPEFKIFELNVTISIGGGDMGSALSQKIISFLVQQSLASKCSLEHRGTIFHLHFQMVIRIQAKSMVAITKLLKVHTSLKNASRLIE